MSRVELRQREQNKRGPMKIAYLVSQYPTVGHSFIFREIRQLRAQGLDVRVASIREPDRTPERLMPEEREEMERTYYVKPLGLFRGIVQHIASLASSPIRYSRGLIYAIRLGGLDLRKVFLCLLYFGEAVIVGRWMEQEGLRHVHTHFSSTVALIATRAFAITMSATVHGPDEFIDPAGYWLREKIDRATFLVAISEYGRSQLMNACDYQQWNKLEVVPLGVEPSALTGRLFRHDPAPFQIFFVGRLAPVKGLHLLIAAVDLLCKEGRDVRLRLIGDGPERWKLETDVKRRGLNSRVVFEGQIHTDQVRVLLNDADVFAMSSFAEGVPVVLMEAMSLMIPCVAPQIGGIPELIRNGIDGLLVPPSNHVELARAIAILMDEPTLRRRLGETGREQVLERYNLSRNTERLANVFRNRLTPAPATSDD
jgi:colanic acid/amylovoran biosynthesis glycosyltransferase